MKPSKNFDDQPNYKHYAKTFTFPAPFVPNWKRNEFKSVDHAALTAIKQVGDKFGKKKKPEGYVSQFGDVVLTYKNMRFIF